MRRGSIRYTGLRRKRCPHSNLRGIYGDEVNAVGGWRLQCRDCLRFLDGPPTLAGARAFEGDDSEDDFT